MGAGRSRKQNEFVVFCFVLFSGRKGLFLIPGVPFLSKGKRKDLADINVDVQLNKSLGSWVMF